MADFKVTVRGLPDLKAALREIAPKLRRRALRNALAAGARVVQKAMRDRTPVLKTTTYAGASAIRRGVRRPGTVQKAIAVRTSKLSTRRGDVGVFVNVRPARAGQRGARNPNDPYYWRWLNFGTTKMGGAGFVEHATKFLSQALAVFTRTIGPQIERLNRGRSERL
jgi:HK97 gp10 family phage protein